MLHSKINLDPLLPSCPKTLLFNICTILQLFMFLHKDPWTLITLKLLVLWAFQLSFLCHMPCDNSSIQLIHLVFYFYLSQNCLINQHLILCSLWSLPAPVLLIIKTFKNLSKCRYSVSHNISMSSSHISDKDAYYSVVTSHFSFGSVFLYKNCLSFHHLL